MTLFAHLRPVGPPPGIDLRLCDVAALCREVRGAALVCADPPWTYDNDGTRGNADDKYDLIGETEIVAHLDAAYDVAARDCRLACWYTWPKAAEWFGAGGAGPRWGAMTTGGAWVKTGQVGVGYHWRGQSEPVAVFTKGTTGRPGALLLNAHVSTPGAHSEKPVAWLRGWVRAWTDPGDLVVDLYAGLAPLARACWAEGRRYVGAEIDEERRDRALSALARYVSENG